MPHCAITMLPGRTDEAKKALADRIQKVLLEEFTDLKPEMISVSIEDVERSNWISNINSIAPKAKWLIDSNFRNK